jgi:hypothetical protein
MTTYCSTPLLRAPRHSLVKPRASLRDLATLSGARSCCRRSYDAMRCAGARWRERGCVRRFTPDALVTSANPTQMLRATRDVTCDPSVSHYAIPIPGMGGQGEEGCGEDGGGKSVFWYHPRFLAIMCTAAGTGIIELVKSGDQGSKQEIALKNLIPRRLTGTSCRLFFRIKMIWKIAQSIML